MTDRYFVEGAEKINDSAETLNWYRNLYHCENETTERGIVARAINDILPEYVHQKAEIKRLEYTLMGVMHSVDKWLEGDELKQDETNRAATMREKTLKIVEKQQAEFDILIRKKEALRDEIAELQAKNDELTKENSELHKICTRAIKSYKETRVESMAELTKDIIHNILPQYLYGHDEAALRIGFAISERARELAGEIWHL